MKKLFTSFISISLLTSVFTALTANASERYIVDDESYICRIYEKIDAYSEYYGVDLYAGINETSFYQENNENKERFYCGGTFKFDTYKFLSEEDAQSLTEYLAENYPDFTLNLNADEEYVIDYGTEKSIEEKVKIAIEIKENLGLNYFSAVALLPYYITFTRLGDLDSDGTVNALDASNILTYYSDSQTGNTDTYTDEDIADITLLGDYDADGAVNALDASLVLKEYAETQTE